MKSPENARQVVVVTEIVTTITQVRREELGVDRVRLQGEEAVRTPGAGRACGRA